MIVKVPYDAWRPFLGKCVTCIRLENPPQGDVRRDIRGTVWLVDRDLPWELTYATPVGQIECRLLVPYIPDYALMPIRPLPDGIESYEILENDIHA